jgi:two-component system response regulator LytT
MEPQFKKDDTSYSPYSLNALGANKTFNAFDTVMGTKSLFLENIQINQDDRLTKLTPRADKKSFLVFKHNKYNIVPTENIAFFYIKYESTEIVCFDRQEYSVNYSLEHIQHLLPDVQFFRLNRQYLINFNAVKEVEHYFARKLLVNLIIPLADKLLVSKEKARSFLQWLENR